MVHKRSERLDRAFAALADPTRRSIVARLARGPATVSELAEPFAMSLPAVAKHLRVLETAGLIASDKAGRSRRCRLVDERLGEAQAWITAHRALWERQFDALAGYLDEAGDGGEKG